MTLAERIEALATRIATEINMVRGEMTANGFTLTETSPGSGLFEMTPGGGSALIETTPGSGLYELVN